jgi:hypothetical protein
MDVLLTAWCRLEELQHLRQAKLAPTATLMTDHEGLDVDIPFYCIECAASCTRRSLDGLARLAKGTCRQPAACVRLAMRDRGFGLPFMPNPTSEEEFLSAEQEREERRRARRYGWWDSWLELM